LTSEQHRLCIECFNELDDDTEQEGRCLSCEEGMGSTWPWGDFDMFEEIPLDELDD